MKKMKININSKSTLFKWVRHLMDKKEYYIFFAVLLTIMMLLIFFRNFNIYLVLYGMVVAIILLIFEKEIRKRL